MNKTQSRFLHLVITVTLISALLILAGCSKQTTTTTTTTTTTQTTTTTTTMVAPTLTITSPADGASLPAGSITVNIQANNFSVVDKQGQANISGQGHVHYFLDVDAPTTQGQPAIPANGVWTHVAATTYTFVNVAPGTHSISVELVNNDHTPLNPPVVRKISINVISATTTTTTTAVTTTTPATTTSSSTTTTPATTTTTPSATTTTTTTTTSAGTPITINLTAQGMAFSLSTITVPHGARVTMNFNNADSVSHNFALYTNSSAAPPALFQGQIVAGPATVVYTFTAPATPGTYFFRCDIHPTLMTGSFNVQ